MIRLLRDYAWPDYECEDCISMRDHGCWCSAVGAGGPGVQPSRGQKLVRRFLDWYDGNV